MTIRDRIAERIAHFFGRWHDNGLPDELQFGEIEPLGVAHGYMRRMAQMTVKLNIAFGPFAVIGIEHARMALRAWRPRHLLLMDDVSCALRPVERRCNDGLPVPEIHIRRSLHCIANYLEYMGTPLAPDEIRSRIEDYIATMKQARIDQLDADASPDLSNHS